MKKTPLNALIRVLSLLAALGGVAVNRVDADPSVNDILSRMDRQYDIRSDLTVRMSLTEQRPEEGVRLFEGIYYRRDSDDAFLLVMVEPEAERGNGYLRVGENMWLYRRNTRTFQIMHRDQAIGGTGANAEDFEKRKMTELYEPILDDSGGELIREETLGRAQIPVYRLEIRASVRDVEYPRLVLWVRRDNFLLLKEEAYSLSGTLMETSYYPRYTEVEGSYIPLQMVFVDEFDVGERTVVELSGVSLEAIDDAVFTTAYLESLSK